MSIKNGPVFLLVFLITGYILIFPAMERSRIPVKSMQARGMILPAPVVKLISLEFKTVVANFLFARASQYFGGKIELRQSATIDDLKWFYRNILVIIELDPYLEDPYYFGNAFLSWDAGRYNEANQLLQKGSDARVWDWQFPFFIGFNKFYFLHDSKGGAEYLSIAAQRPNAPTFLPTLAARLYNKAGKTENAINFLIAFWQNEKDERIKKQYEIRLDALKKLLLLERAVLTYKKKTGKVPRSVQALIQAGIIKNIPEDPYGGKFYVTKNGSIMTTSNLAFKQQKQRVQDQK